MTLADYKIPGVLDTPPEINAICNATGARIRQLPMIPERVLEAIESVG